MAPMKEDTELQAQWPWTSGAGRMQEGTNEDTGLASCGKTTKTFCGKITSDQG